MDKNKFVKLGAVGFITAVGYAVYTNVKRKLRPQEDSEVIDITPEESDQKNSLE